MQGIEEFIVVTVGRGFLVGGGLHALDYFCITNMDFLTDSGAFPFSFPQHMFTEIHFSLGSCMNAADLLKDVRLKLRRISREEQMKQSGKHISTRAFPRYLPRDRDSLSIKECGEERGGALITLWNLKTINFVCQVMFLSSQSEF